MRSGTSPLQPGVSRHAKLETERENGIDDDNRHPSKDNIFMLKKDKGTNRKIGLSQKIGFNIRLILNYFCEN